MNPLTTRIIGLVAALCWVLAACGGCNLMAQPAAGAGTSLSGGIVKLPVIDQQDIRFSQLSVNGESLQSRIWSVAQDNYGFMWLGTSHGVYRYDGYSLKTYRHERGDANSLSDDPVKVVYKDRAGILWVATANGGLDRLDPTQDTFTHYRHQGGNSGSLSDNRVNCVYQDRSGALWVGTHGGLDRLDQTAGTFFHYSHNPQNAESLSSNTVNSIFEDRVGNLWVGTVGGLNKLERPTGRFSRFLHDPRDPHSLGHDYVNFIMEDQSGVLWLASPLGSGLSALDVKTNRFTRYSFHPEEPGSQSVVGVNSIHEDPDGALWLCTVDRGLLKLDRERRKFIRYTKQPANPNSLPHDTVHTLFEDAEGVVWVGTQSGLSRFPRRPSPFVNYKHQAGTSNSLHDDMIWSVQTDSKGFLWIGTEDGLNRLDRRTGQFTLYQHDPNDVHSLSYNKVAAIREDPSGALWLGTYGGGLNRFDRATGRFFAYRHDPKNPGSLSSDSVLCLLMDRQGVLWVGTQGGGLNRFEARSGRFTAYQNAPIDPDNLITTIFEDRAGTLWLGSTLGGLYRFDRNTEQFTAYHHNPEDPRSLSHNKVNAIREDRQGRLWVGTENGLNLMDRSGDTFTSFTRKDGLPDNAIKAILEDDRGYLWLATYNGLSRFHSPTKTFRNYFESDGLPSNFFDPYGAEDSFQSQSGEMVFGTSNGLTAFYPNQLSANPHVPPVVLTDFSLFNTPVPKGEDSLLRNTIWATDSLTLTHKQSIFTLEFAALSYMAPEKNRYRYRLDGLETQWNAVDSGRRRATYTSLPAGKYVFRVQGSNNDQVWNEKGVTLAITVLPSWWATWWFRSIVALSIVGLIFAAHRSRVRSLQLAATRLEHLVSERTRELQIAKNAAETAKDAAEAANRAKSVFLANMSHELRTPLNAILGFSNLLRDDSISDRQRNDLDIISRSGEHLLGLINNVLDVAKVEVGPRSVEIAPCDLQSLVRDVTDMMRVRAVEKKLALRLVKSPEFPRYVRTDAAKLRQVLINLLGNAIKYTEKGAVTLRVNARPANGAEQLLLTFDVEDTGVGIAAGDQGRIFEAFVQVSKPATQNGTGLGLTITRQFVQLMGGTIHVESAPGKGSLFRVEVPVARAQKSEVEAPPSDWEPIIGLDPGQPEYRILIVEDERENWMVLERLLQNAGFQVQVAEDGEQGVEAFRTWRPHFIWMDLRMPVMDGVEAARRIRSLDGGRDVKIAAVTASVFADQRSEVLAAGLDDFVLKPYQPREIFDRMARHLGVRYRRAEASPPPPAESREVSRLERLAALPQALRTEVRDAVIALNVERIAGAIGRVSERDPVLGGVLARCAERFAYTAILDAIDACESHESEGSA